MVNVCNMATPDNSDEEHSGAFTDGDFDDSGDDTENKRPEETDISKPVTEAVNIHTKENGSVKSKELDGQSKVNHKSDQNGFSGDSLVHNDGESGSDIGRDSHGDQNHSIVGILGDQHNHAEQRLAARRAARAEAREIRMRELERQQREQENNADKAYDMYAETVSRRGGSRLAAAGLHSPRRSSEDSADDVFTVKDLRHEIKEVEDKFRKAMILNAQLDNDKAALGYQLELLKDKIEELQEEYAQLHREHREKCSAHERLRREHVALERELSGARGAVRARDAAAAAAGFAFVDAAGDDPAAPPLALVSHQAEQLLNDAGEGTLDVRLQKLLSSKQALESEVRKLKLQLNDERAARQNGAASHLDQELETEMETLRRSVSEARARAARAEAEAALQGAAVARLSAQLARLRALSDTRDAQDDQLQAERRRLQREAREALNRVEELETENSHLTKRLDKLKNAKSALLKDL